MSNRYNPNVEPAPRDPNARKGFQDINKEVKATRGVKIKSKASVQAESDEAAREEYRKRFDNNADQTISYKTEQANTAVECINNFMKISNDKTLIRNKGGGIAEDVEKEIRTSLLTMALDMNNDETEENNGMGSVAVISAVTKVILNYRDRLNELEFEHSLLRKEIGALKKQSSEAKREP